MFQGRTILVTGGTGSWGQELVKKLLEYNPAEIRIFSRNEFAQVNMQQQFRQHPQLQFIIGDVRDYSAVADACRNADIVFHLAALKHVPICELQPGEAIKTNIQGTENIIRASIAQGVSKVIDVSTDKAVDPINLYGMTKAIGEKLMIRANEHSEKTRFICVRGGNVLGTNGSIVPLFKKLIKQQQPVPLTSHHMTRFFQTLPKTIDLLLKAAEEAIGGETFVIKMKSCRIADLAHVMKNVLSAQQVSMKEIGIRPGEKLHEVLVSVYETPHTYHFQEQYLVILPSHPGPLLLSRYEHLQRVEFDSYASQHYLMTQEEITEMLLESKMLLEEEAP
ncbi:polysaccharide biosynthesis protein [Paenibacillus sp. y28]|uniref:polysaccharide biosynthesis protein n=1 Tax=Paenibacillus sp. y28 TaxID=3129110 RepID=UPI003019EDCB